MVAKSASPACFHAPEERQREHVHFLSPDDVAALAEAVTPRFATLVYAAAYTGIRAGGLAALRVTGLNLLAGTVDVGDVGEVGESMMEVGGQLIAGPTKTGPKRAADKVFYLERTTGFEPATPTLARLCSTN
jgi:hypothetical protein